MEGTVELNDPLAARRLVQAVDILGDDRAQISLPLQLHKRRWQRLGFTSAAG